ncbi:MAG: metal-binding protein [Deltaproteobacteria bacterium]|nr:MAG: metal-binding protein [Deltaproteobacteria bacterium]
MTQKFSDCARCPFAIAERLCRTPNGKAPAFCPTRDLSQLTQASLKIYKQDKYAEFARQASIQEADGYADKDLGYARVRPAKTRIEEIAEFANKMNFRRLGLAFCVGLRREAKIVADIYSDKGFEVVSVICKTGCSDKNLIGLNDEQKIVPNEPEAMCNPAVQALVLNNAETDFNILLGLCVGHDSIFLKEADAPCTVLAVKDRVLGHNPLAAVYNIDSYYRSLK